MTPSLPELCHLLAAPLCWFSRVSSLPPPADGDPHFVVEFPLSKLTACFNINGEPGHVLRLVSDHESSGKSPGASC